jgi:hypothetical protein
LQWKLLVYFFLNSFIIEVINHYLGMLELGDRIEGKEGVFPVIRGPEGLPMLDPITKKAPDNLANDYGDYIRPGHGFAQVCLF